MLITTLYFSLENELLFLLKLNSINAVICRFLAGCVMAHISLHHVTCTLLQKIARETFELIAFSKLLVLEY